MAEDDIVSGIGEQVSSVAKTSVDALIIIFAAAAVIGIIVMTILLIRMSKSYKHIVKIRVITNDRKFVIEDKAREVKIDGVPYWKLKKRKDYVPVPPPEATELTAKGNLYAEAYYTDEEEYKWIWDNGAHRDSFKAFTTVERSLYVQRLKNAMLRKKKGIWDMLQQYITPIILLILVVLIIIFWQDLYKPIGDVQESNLLITERQAFITEQQARITAVLLGDANIDSLKLEQTVPSNTGGAP